MARLTLIIISLFLLPFFETYGQTSLCKADTFNLTLAYEIGGQFVLDDQIIKPPGFVQFNGQVTLQDYKKGHFELSNQCGSGSAFRKFQDCKISINTDSLFKYASIQFDSLRTKTWTKVNETFGGEGETMLGTKTEMRPIEFKYKIFHVKFVAVYVGDNEKTLVNIDRKNKNEKQLMETKCAQYIIIKIIQISTLKQN